MENQPPSGSASSWLHRRSPSPNLSETDQEIARLKERLNFYESFDQIIQENVSRASELLKNAASVRENAEQELAAAREELERSRIAERANFRSLLSNLLDEVTNMQVQVERLARKVADALDEVEASLPAPDLDRLPGTPPALRAIGAPGQNGSAATGTAAAETPSAPEATLDEPPIASSGDIEDADAIAAAGTPAPRPTPVTPESFEDADAAMSAPDDDGSEAPVSQLDSIAEAVAFAEIAAEPIPVEESEIEPDSGDGFVTASSSTERPAMIIGPEGEPYAANAAEETARFAALSEESIAVAQSEAEPDSGDSFASAAASPDTHTTAAGEPETALARDGAGDADAPERESVAASAADEGAGEPAPAAAGTGEPRDLTNNRAAGTGALAATRAPDDADRSPSESARGAADSAAGGMPGGDIRPFPGVTTAQPAFRRTGTGELRFPNPLPPAVPRPVEARPLAPRGSSTTVLVHGVPRATTALSLKRYLEGLAHVSAVEPREYAEGILRLQVIGQRPLQIDDLRGWPDGSGLETVHLREDLLEIRLPH